MGGLSARRLAAVGAVGVVVLWVVGFFLAGSPPKFNDSPDKIALFFNDHHKAVLIASVMVAIGIAFYLGVMAQLTIELRGAGQRTLAAIVGLGAAASAGLFAIGDGLYGVLSQAAVEPGGDPGLLKALYQFDQFAGVPMYWLVLVVVIPVTIAASRGVFPGWSMWLNALIAVLLVLGGISVKASGAFAAGTGAFAQIAFLAAMVFLLELGALFWSSRAQVAST